MYKWQKIRTTTNTTLQKTSQGLYGVFCRGGGWVGSVWSYVTVRAYSCRSRTEYRRTTTAPLAGIERSKVKGQCHGGRAILSHSVVLTGSEYAVQVVGGIAHVPRSGSDRFVPHYRDPELRGGGTSYHQLSGRWHRRSVKQFTGVSCRSETSCSPDDCAYRYIAR